MKFKKSKSTFIGSSFKGFLILILALFLGTITSCDFKHSFQHQFGFETTGNQNISKTTVQQNCGHSNVEISQSFHAERISQVKGDVQKFHVHLANEFFFADHTQRLFYRKSNPSTTTSSCPLFILYKKRKVLS